MKVSWNRFRCAPTGTGTVVKVFYRDESPMVEIAVNVQASDPEWTTFNISTLIMPAELCVPVSE